ncbi:SDR family oxidoreductase [Hoeflea sp. YIM 152468]|uniref:SDR family oxidoreductase n=1 Tax=Hoeflea sp. YIM 152468 TaxID=3031759 RepID=UPI0023D9C63A|nr:SDR family oxidoreductase [Hoeflea sp. YIM 152468]MDF1606593.1 SDR family oxidoreductase [Hoeflea sp. YIM 152468]
MATIAVTAASGHLGRAIVKALTENGGGDTIVAIARTPENARGLGVDVRRGDYTDRASFEAALNGVDTVLLVSGMDEPGKRIGQHRNVIEAARTAGVTKIVYTSVQGPDQDSSFSPIVQSNRQTEQDVRDSGLAWVIGRNGIYIEPDIEYIDTYKALGEIANCAGDGKCGYTTRDELAHAYVQMLVSDAHNGRTFNLHGRSLTQTELAACLNQALGTSLVYRRMGVEAYRQDRVNELGEFIGAVIAGIYTGIRDGAFDHASNYAEAAGRPHRSWDDYFSALKAGGNP